ADRAAVGPIWRSIWRRMSFIGSTERTRGTASKLFSGGGDGVNHSSVLAFHGSGPAMAPALNERATLATLMRMPMASTHEPIVEIRLYVLQPELAEYS